VKIENNKIDQKMTSIHSLMHLTIILTILYHLLSTNRHLQSCNKLGYCLNLYEIELYIFFQASKLMTNFSKIEKIVEQRLERIKL